MDYHKDEGKFIELLNQEYHWPAQYIFKFIVKTGSGKEINSLFSASAKITERPSSGGKYVSYTIRCNMQNAEEILAIYTKASDIPVIISL